MPINRQELPDKNNFYASFRNVNKEKIKEQFLTKGWHLRKYSWTDYELRNDWSDLLLEGDETNPLLNGAVVYLKANIEILENTFKSLDCDYQYEFYDDKNKILIEKRFDR